jgi:hypothetical protein
MNIRGPARAKSLAEGTYWEALKYVQFHEAASSLGAWSITAAAMAQDDVALTDLVEEGCCWCRRLLINGGYQSSNRSVNERAHRKE